MQTLFGSPGILVNGAIAAFTFALLAFRIFTELRPAGRLAAISTSGFDERRFYFNFVVGSFFVASVLAVREFATGKHWRAPDTAPGLLERMAASPGKLALGVAIAALIVGIVIVLKSRGSKG